MCTLRCFIGVVGSPDCIARHCIKDNCVLSSKAFLYINLLLQTEEKANSFKNSAYQYNALPINPLLKCQLAKVTKRTENASAIHKSEHTVAILLQVAVEWQLFN